MPKNGTKGPQEPVIVTKQVKSVVEPFILQIMQSGPIKSIISGPMKGKTQDIIATKHVLSFLSGLHNYYHWGFEGTTSEYAISKSRLIAMLGDSQYRKFLKKDHWLNEFFILSKKSGYKDTYSNAFRATSLLQAGLAEAYKAMASDGTAQWCNWEYGINYLPIDRKPPQVYDLHKTLNLAESSLNDPEIKKMRLIKSEYFNGSQLNQFYCDKKPRYYGTGWNLQSTSRVLRKIYIRGHWDHDFEVCAPTILSQRYYQQGNGILSNLSDYIENRSEYRMRISQDAQVGVPLVKQAITALLFGGEGLSYGTKIYKDLANACGSWQVTKEKKNAIENHQYFVHLRNDIKKIFRELKTNDLISQRPNETRKQLVARYYFTEEQNLLNESCAYLSSIGNESGLVFHDGFLTQDSINHERLSDYLKAKTGLTMKIESDYID